MKKNPQLETLRDPRASIPEDPLDELTFEFNLPPSVNRLYRRGRHGQVILTDEALGYREHVKQVIGEKHLHQLNRFPVDPENVYGLAIVVHLETIENPGWFEFYTKGENKGKRKAQTRYKIVDVDNRVKFLQDVVTKTVGIPNDAQIFVGHQKKVKGLRDYVTVLLYVADPKSFLEEEVEFLKEEEEGK